MEAASARDQVVEEELSDQEEVRSFYYSKRSQLKIEGLSGGLLHTSTSV